jgi:hypothetical protein
MQSYHVLAPARYGNLTCLSAFTSVGRLSHACAKVGGPALSTMSRRLPGSFSSAFRSAPSTAHTSGQMSAAIIPCPKTLPSFAQHITACYHQRLCFNTGFEQATSIRTICDRKVSGRWSSMAYRTRPEARVTRCTRQDVVLRTKI